MVLAKIGGSGRESIAHSGYKVLWPGTPCLFAAASRRKRPGGGVASIGSQIDVISLYSLLRNDS